MLVFVSGECHKTSPPLYAVPLIFFFFLSHYFDHHNNTGLKYEGYNIQQKYSPGYIKVYNYNLMINLCN